MGNTALYIPKEGLQHSPKEASKDKKPVQRIESKPKGLFECVCMFVWCVVCLCVVCLCGCLCLSIGLSGDAVLKVT